MLSRAVPGAPGSGGPLRRDLRPLCQAEGMTPGASGSERDLTVAVTGPTGTFGFGLVPLLQGDDRVTRIIGTARRPFDPAGYGWTKMEYRRGDVRDPAALRDAFG